MKGVLSDVFKITAFKHWILPERCLFIALLLVTVWVVASLRAQARAEHGIKPSFEKVHKWILEPKCSAAWCHNIGQRFGVMDLSNPDAYNFLVGVPSIEVIKLLRVEPGKPEKSYLIMKVRGDPGIIGMRMPANGNWLRPEEVALIWSWIEEGAQK